MVPRMNARSPHGLPVIGLVGAIGAGKSTVAQELAALGCVVSDSDAHARAALADPRIQHAITQRWGSGVLQSDGMVDRAKVAARIFTGADASMERAWLESIVHPFIHERRGAMFANTPPGTRALVIDAPLLIEAGLVSECNSVLFIDAPHSVRLERLQRTRGWTEAELDRREKSQMPLDQKRSLADHVMVNDGPLGSLRACVARTLDLILEEFVRKK
jgi:dephospho-CoA kinase